MIDITSGTYKKGDMYTMGGISSTFPSQSINENTTEPDINQV